ncbi:predicted protein [Lodderomyces elongisporus NRRL YB-4239]|uniref:Uncharacterized protein n=1 Tax=Lodderomyces elongisporus (strain ATCC 11503 / CBS 2605 / JCM 1781 / NBRC 1676 / NRRL YB-4239) TaxID=379508 RepID=A5DWA6_LODEL|nr:predicted protein [Lodderomyces elongisporus NRRL YB-4239]
MRGKQVLSCTDLPPAIPALHYNDDLHLAVDTYTPGLFEIDDMPLILRASRISERDMIFRPREQNMERETRRKGEKRDGSGRSGRRWERLERRERVVSAPPQLYTNWRQKALPQAPKQRNLQKHAIVFNVDLDLQKPCYSSACLEKTIRIPEMDSALSVHHSRAVAKVPTLSSSVSFSSLPSSSILEDLHEMAENTISLYSLRDSLESNVDSLFANDKVIVKDVDVKYSGDDDYDYDYDTYDYDYVGIGNSVGGVIIPAFDERNFTTLPTSKPELNTHGGLNVPKIREQRNPMFLELKTFPARVETTTEEINQLSKHETQMFWS